MDAKDDDASTFYEHHGFLMLSAKARQLALPLASFEGNVAEPARCDAGHLPPLTRLLKGARAAPYASFLSLG